MSERMILKEDLIIPAGTVFTPGPARTDYGPGNFETDVGLTPDDTMTVVVYYDPALLEFFDYEGESE